MTMTWPLLAVAGALIPLLTTPCRGQSLLCTPVDGNSTNLVCTPYSTSSSEAANIPTVDTGDTAWVLASSALVMIMTPGLAFFYGGLVRAKHSINTLLMSYIALGLITVHWVVFGYTFAFGPGTKGYGNFDWVGLRHVGQEPNPDYAATIPHLVYMVFQMMFAIITPAIISGAIVERMSFRAYIIFLLLWTTIVYDCIAHWVWAGWTQHNPDGTSEYKMGFLRDLGALDFAGGTVVHMSSGFSALVACIIVGKRSDYDSKKPAAPHNVPFVLLGAALLWFGWFGFNGGSALGSNGLAALAFVNTQIATGMAFVVWVILDALIKKKVTAIGAASGAVVGLVAITPGAGYVHPASSLAIGAITVFVCYFALEGKAKYLPRIFPQLDDSLDVFSCHGVGGMMGCLLTGFFASTEVNEFGADGVFFGGGKLLGYQVAAILITLVFSCGVTAILLLILKYTIGLTVDSEKALEGLDLHLHGSQAYFYDDVLQEGEIPMESHPTKVAPEDEPVAPTPAPANV